MNTSANWLTKTLSKQTTSFLKELLEAGPPDSLVDPEIVAILTKRQENNNGNQSV